MIKILPQVFALFCLFPTMKRNLEKEYFGNVT